MKGANLKVKQAGFTLIEVLIATVILFSSIAMVSLVYRGAFLSSEKANAHIVINGVLPAVLSTIQADLKELAATGQISITQKSKIWNVDYSWQANVVNSKKAPEKLDIDSGKLVSSKNEYQLWQVDLTLSFKSIQKQYQFSEFSWVEN